VKEELAKCKNPVHITQKAEVAAIVYLKQPVSPSWRIEKKSLQHYFSVSEHQLKRAM